MSLLASNVIYMYNSYSSLRVISWWILQPDPLLTLGLTTSCVTIHMLILITQLHDQELPSRFPINLYPQPVLLNFSFQTRGGHSTEAAFSIVIQSSSDQTQPNNETSTQERFPINEWEQLSTLPRHFIILATGDNISYLGLKRYLDIVNDSHQKPIPNYVSFL